MCAIIMYIDLQAASSVTVERKEKSTVRPSRRDLEMVMEMVPSQAGSLCHRFVVRLCCHVSLLVCGKYYLIAFPL